MTALTEEKKIAAERADWLVDAVATATQDRKFLRGDPEHDEVATDAIFMNGQKAIEVAIARALEAASLSHKAPADGLEERVREFITKVERWRDSARGDVEHAGETEIGGFSSVPAKWHAGRRQSFDTVLKAARALVPEVTNGAGGDGIEKECAHYGGSPGRCLLNERTWAPGVTPKRCIRCPQGAEWLPIDSAPKDGTKVLIAHEGLVSIGRWAEYFAPVYGYPEGTSGWCSSELDRLVDPTHWRPLPPPPAGKPGGE